MLTISSLQGRASAEQAAAEASAERELASARDSAAAELDAWDARFGLRAAPRAQLLEAARARGIRGAARLTKAQLADVLEAAMAEEEEQAADAAAALRALPTDRAQAAPRRVPRPHNEELAAGSQAEDNER